MAKRSFIQTLFGIHPQGDQSRNAARVKARENAAAAKKKPGVRAIPPSPKRSALSAASRTHRPHDTAYWNGEASPGSAAPGTRAGVDSGGVDIHREAPAGKYFYILEGPELKSVADLKNALDWISDAQFASHVDDERNDFADWVRDVFGYDKLAQEIREALGRKSMKNVLERAM